MTVYLITVQDYLEEHNYVLTKRPCWLSGYHSGLSSKWSEFNSWHHNMKWTVATQLYGCVSSGFPPQ